ncbi:hypothetical protein PFY01_09255 [Brevundimonas vesicularis]|uniref:hypothetical protein n=1 Tax=Brevundimonas vesicularis TaxID=41276 RepID=UPI0022EC8766|nr:hypothetical protein [Brevundimonas vesicularis]WBT04841.1 hypothetical protein PFY01_08810 [Brevundimonas vesicularis]WBT04928.1 hypothetical protein PFY01_09255 [Brevundimonas vesicularis]
MRMWLGDTDAREDADCWPLREIVSLCGLTLGGEDAPDDRAVRGHSFGKKRQQSQRVRLATVGGQLLDLDHCPIGGVGNHQRFDDQREAGR